MRANYLLRAVVVCGLHAAVHCGFPLVTPSQGEPWPAPQQMDMYDTFYWTKPSQIRFKTTHYSCGDLEDAIIRYHEILRKMSEAKHASKSRIKSSVRNVLFQSDQPFLTNVEVYMDQLCNSSELPFSDMQETYIIKINTPDSEGRAQIISNNVWGAIRGLETFVQLIYFSEKHQQFHLRQGMIRDFPRYRYRGLLLDTSRHFLSVDSLKTTLDLMAFNKFNVFHWHIVDDPSFPFVSETFPELSARGAFSKHLVYSPGDVDEIIEYARKRGIRVIPEFDTPGHVRSWGAAVEGLLTTCYNESSGLPDGTFGPLDPTKNTTYTFVEQLLTEVTNRFPDKYIHLGGDEVSFGFNCWLSNPNIRKWMAELNISTPQQVENEYIQQLLRIASNLPSHPEYIVWQEVIDNNITVKPNTIVHVWKGGWQDDVATATSLGHRVILSSPWYLNYISYGIDWPQYYITEPEAFNGTEDQRRLVEGGEACMWGEYVDDTNVVQRTWPRAAAVAERLWSAKEVKNTKAAAPRMEEHRCRLLGRGYAVEPANGPGFCPTVLNR